jgi:hypothetical protein
MIAEHDAVKIIDAMYRVTGDNFFVTSFCGRHADDYVNTNGLLSQWRGYGGDQGVMIEFETASTISKSVNSVLALSLPSDHELAAFLENFGKSPPQEPSETDPLSHMTVNGGAISGQRGGVKVGQL